MKPIRTVAITIFVVVALLVSAITGHLFVDQIAWVDDSVLLPYDRKVSCQVTQSQWWSWLPGPDTRTRYISCSQADEMLQVQAPNPGVPVPVSITNDCEIEGSTIAVSSGQGVIVRFR